MKPPIKYSKFPYSLRKLAYSTYCQLTIDKDIYTTIYLIMTKNNLSLVLDLTHSETLDRCQQSTTLYRRERVVHIKFRTNHDHPHYKYEIHLN